MERVCKEVGGKWIGVLDEASLNQREKGDIKEMKFLRGYRNWVQSCDVIHPNG